MKEIMKYLLENHAEVIAVALEHTKTIGELGDVEKIIRTSDYDALIKLRETNEPLVDAILEADY